MTKNNVSTRKHVESLLKARTQYVNNPSIEMVPEMVDLNTAIDKARLSRRQSEAITYVYGLDLTQEAAAAEMGVSFQAVGKFAREACGKIAAIYDKEGGLSVG